MFCSNCGNKITEPNKFCAHCGTKIVSIGKDVASKNQQTKQRKSVPSSNINEPTLSYELRPTPYDKQAEEERKEPLRITVIVVACVTTILALLSIEGSSNPYDNQVIAIVAGFVGSLVAHGLITGFPAYVIDQTILRKQTPIRWGISLFLLFIIVAIQLVSVFG